MSPPSTSVDSSETGGAGGARRGRGGGRVEGLAQRRHAGEAVLAVRRQGPRDDVGEVGGHVRAVDARGAGGEDLAEEDGEVRRVEGIATRERLVHDDADGPDVRAGVERLAADLLGGHVDGRPDERPRLGELGEVGVVVEALRGAEVDELGARKGPGSGRRRAWARRRLRRSPPSGPALGRAPGWEAARSRAGPRMGGGPRPGARESAARRSAPVGGEPPRAPSTRKMLEGLMSRWRTPCRWAIRSASRMGRITSRSCSGRRRLTRSRRCSRSSPTRRAWTRKRAPSSPSRPMSMISTMLGCRSFAALFASCWKRRTCALPSA